MRAVTLLLVALALSALVSVSGLQTVTRLRARVPVPQVQEELDFIDESSFVDATPAPATPTATKDAVPDSEPAKIGKAASNLKKPIIFSADAAADAKDPSAPLTGKPPANLKKAAVSEAINGGAVQYEVSKTAAGCPCRKQVPEKYRYDVKFKKAQAPPAPCPCADKKATPAKPEDKLPPIVAEIKPEPKKAEPAKPCAADKAAPKPVEKVAPQYYPSDEAREKQRQEWLKKQAPCNTTAPAQPKKETVNPEFYPPKKL